MTSTPSRRLLGPAVVGVLLVPLLSLTMVFTAPTAAQAWANPPGPVTLGEAKKTLPAAEIVKRGGRFSPWIRGANVLWSAYQIADSVFNLPGGMSPNQGGTTAKTSAFGCTTALGEVVLGVAELTASFTWAGCGDARPGQMFNYVYADQLWCKNPAGSTPPYGMAGDKWAAIRADEAGGNIGSGSQTLTIPSVCPPGSKVMGAEVRVEMGSSPVLGSSGVRVVGDPYPASEYKQTTTVKCRQADGSTVTITDTLLGYPDKVAIPSCADRVPGSIPWEVIVKGGADGGLQETLTDIGVKEDVVQRYPGCFDASGAMTCRIRVWVNGQPCTFGQVGCGWWWEDQEDPSRQIQCKWGGNVVALGECVDLKQAYRRKQAGTATGTEADGSPKLDYPNDPADLPAPGTAPAPGEGGVPREGTNPLGPRTRPDATTDPDTQSCLGAAWSLNPVDWVYVPVKCALMWAFMPHPDQWGWSGIVDEAKARPPFSVVVGVGDTLAAIGGAYANAGGCSTLLDFGPANQEISCATVRDAPGLRELYALVQAAMIGGTLWGVFVMLARSAGGRQ